MGLGRYTVGLENGGKIVNGVLVGELWELLLAHLYPLTACSSQEPWVKLLQSTCYKENEWLLRVSPIVHVAATGSLSESLYGNTRA